MAQVVLSSIATADFRMHCQERRPPRLHQLKDLIEATVADVFAVDVDQIRGESRGQMQVAQARQVAMYLMHCAFGIPLTTIGHVFSRDRTTVRHACKIVEDRRDDQSYDYILHNLEEIVRHRAKFSIIIAVA